MPANPLTDPNWAGDLADTVERVVGTVREKATTPVVHVTRGVVYGLLGAFLGLTAVVLLLIVLTRALQALLDLAVSPERGGLPELPHPRGNPQPRRTVAPPEASTPRRLIARRISMTNVRNVIIVGSGPAGLTAAIYAARANLAPLVIEGEPSSSSDQPGGQLMLTTDVENYPGFPEGIMGPDLMGRFREQAARFGAEFITEKATKVDLQSRPFQVWVRDTVYEADAVIVSTGARALMLGLEAETPPDRPRSVDVRDVRRVLLPRPAHRRRRRRRLGPRGGDLPHQVRRQGHRRSTAATRCGPRRSCRTGRSPTRRSSSCGTPWSRTSSAPRSSKGIVVANTKTGETSTLPVTGVFVAIGHRPNTDLFAEGVDHDGARLHRGGAPRRHARRGREFSRPLPGARAAGSACRPTRMTG